MSENGHAPADFTHTLSSFTVEGHVFQRQKVPAKLWADTLAEIGVRERAEIEKETGSVLYAVSSDGLHELIALAVRPEDRATWQKLYEDGRLEFGELAALKDWLWEQMTERPFPSATQSSAGPGSDSEATSKGASSSPVEVQTG